MKLLIELTGAAGTGKTRLATLLFKHLLLHEHFTVMYEDSTGARHGIAENPDIVIRCHQRPPKA